MLVKFPVWEYYNTQLGFSLQLNSNTKRTFDSQKSKVLFCVHGAIISQPLFYLPSSSFRHFERSREIFLAHWLSCQMALLVCLFSMRSHTHHFPSCHEDPSASLGMTSGKMPSRCCREERSGGWCLFEALYPLPLARPFSCSPVRCRASARWRPAIWLTLSSTATTKAPRAFP